MYEIGKVYIWIKTDDNPQLIGTETTIIGKMKIQNTQRGQVLCQKTDSLNKDGGPMAARPGYLRPKNPPSGERKITELFQPQPEKEIA